MNTKFKALAALAVGVALVGVSQAQTPPAKPADPAPAAARPQRVVVVNIAKVLREYTKANYEGQNITKRRQFWVTKITPLQEKLKAANAEFSKAATVDLKKKAQEDALAIQRQIEDLDRQAQEELTKMSNDTISNVYKEIRHVIAEMAKANQLDLVLCYPGASKPEDESSPVVARLPCSRRRP